MQKWQHATPPVKQTHRKAQHPQSVHQKNVPDFSEIEQKRKLFSSTLHAQLQETIFQRRQRKIVYKRVIRRRVIRTVLAVPPPPPPSQPPQEEISCDESTEEELVDDDSDCEILLKGGTMEDPSQDSFELVVFSPINGEDNNGSLGGVEVDESDSRSILVDEESTEIEFIADEMDESYEEEEVIDDDEANTELSLTDELVVPLVVDQESQKEEERLELKEEWEYLIDKRTDEGLTKEEEEHLRQIENELFPNRNRTEAALRASVRKHEESVFDHEVGYRAPHILAMVNMAKMELRPPPPKEHRAKFVPVTADAASIGRLMRLKEYTVEAHGKRDVKEFNTKSTDSSYALWISNRSKRGQNRKPVSRRTRSNSQIIVNEAAAVGKLRNRRIADPNGLSRSAHEIDIDDLGDDRHDGAKVFRTEHLIDRRIDGDRLKKSEDWIPGDGDEEYGEVDDVILPTEVQPAFKPIRTSKSQKEMMEELAQGVAEGFWKRHSRLERPGAPLRVTEGCNCKYCPTANAWQTFAFQKKWAEARLPPGVSTTEDPNAHGYLSRLYIPEENTMEMPQEHKEEVSDKVENLYSTDEELIDVNNEPGSGDGTGLILLEISEYISQTDKNVTLPTLNLTPGDSSGLDESPPAEALQAADGVDEAESVNDPEENIKTSGIVSDHGSNSKVVGTTTGLPIDGSSTTSATQAEMKALRDEVTPRRSETKTLALEAKPRRFRPLKWLKKTVFSGKDSNKQRKEGDKSVKTSNANPGKNGGNVSIKPSPRSLPSLPAPIRRDVSEAYVDGISELAVQDNSTVERIGESTRQGDEVEAASQIQGETEVEAASQIQGETDHPKEQTQISNVDEVITAVNLEENSDVNANMSHVAPSVTNEIPPKESIKDRLKRLAMLQAMKEPPADKDVQVELSLTETSTAGETHGEVTADVDDVAGDDNGTTFYTLPWAPENKLEVVEDQEPLNVVNGAEVKGDAQDVVDLPIEQDSAVPDFNVSVASTMVEDPVDSRRTEHSTSLQNSDRANETTYSADQATTHLAVDQTTDEQSACAETSAGDLSGMYVEAIEIHVDRATPASEASSESENTQGPTFVSKDPVVMGNSDDMMIAEQAPQETLLAKQSVTLPDATHSEGTSDGGDSTETPVPPISAIKLIKRRKNNGILAQMCAGTLAPSARYPQSDARHVSVLGATVPPETSQEVTTLMMSPSPIKPQLDSARQLPIPDEPPSTFDARTANGIHQPLTPGQVHVVTRFTRSTPIEV